MATVHKYRIVVETPSKIVKSIWSTLPEDEDSALKDLSEVSQLLDETAKGDLAFLKFNSDFSEGVDTQSGDSFKRIENVRIPKTTLEQSFIYLERMQFEAEN